MPAKFLVVECEDNDNAVKLVKLMLENGFARMMLLDDLSKHPSLVAGPSSASSPGAAISSETLGQLVKKSLKHKLNKSDAETSALMDIFQMSTPELINCGTPKTECINDEESGDCDADNEEPTTTGFNFDFSVDNPSLDLLAQAHCLVGSSNNKGEPSAKRLRQSNGDDEKYYHCCRLCGTRVKAPRGGRWNLQMHVMAMHSQKRPFKCSQCSYTDYRKPGMRKHCVLTHGADLEPVDIATDEKRAEWDSVMAECFPEYAYRTGFLLEKTDKKSD